MIKKSTIYTILSVAIIIVSVLYVSNIKDLETSLAILFGQLIIIFSYEAGTNIGKLMNKEDGIARHKEEMIKRSKEKIKTQNKLDKYESRISDE